MIGVYFESWAMPWSADPNNDLLKVDKRVNLINLAFVSPDCGYKLGSNKWDGTGLNFSLDFGIIQQTIAMLRARGVTVMLSVGGGSYWSVPKQITAQQIHALWDLCLDLGCDGLDIDWEVGVSDSVNAIGFFKGVNAGRPVGRKISFAGFSTGANPKSTNSGDPYSGMNLDILTQCRFVDWVNCMEYDAGKDFDTKASFLNYRKVYSGPLNFGFEIGIQGWGDAILQKEDVQVACSLLTGTLDGIFIWAYYSKSGPGISVGDCIDLSSSIINKPVVTVPTKPPASLTWSCPSSVSIMCPKCNNKILTSWKQG